VDTNRNKSAADPRAATVIGPDAAIQGEIRCKGTIRVEGEIVGRIQCDDTIVVTDTGRVKADLMASQIIISGEVTGNVFAKERCEIVARGKLAGDLTSPRVSIEEGVVFEGKCTMKPPGQAAPAPAPQPPKTAQ